MKLPTTPAEIEKAISDFKVMMETDGWRLYTAILDANIEVLKEQLENGSEGEETKADVDRIRDKIRVSKDNRDTPEMMIKKWEQPEDEIVNDDPYEVLPEPEFDNSK